MKEVRPDDETVPIWVADPAIPATDGYDGLDYLVSLSENPEPRGAVRAVVAEGCARGMAVGWYAPAGVAGPQGPGQVRWRNAAAQQH